MTKTLRVELGANSYPIVVGARLLEKVGQLLMSHATSKKVLIVSDTFVTTCYMPLVRSCLEDTGFDVSTIEVPAGEASKSLAEFSRIQDSLIAHRLDRGSTLIALGGGVVGDLAGFAAAAYLRGIPYVQIPTTLQAQVDASVGGKTAINHPRGKNLIGAFHQPKLVIIDVETLKTLPRRDVCSGLIEVIKMGVIRDKSLFERVEDNLEAILNLDPTLLIEMISQACVNKAKVVAEAEKEGGVRRGLNYGHTFGHALEAVTHYSRYRHGEAVAIGMNCAAQLAVNLGMFAETDFQRQRRLLTRAKLPITFPTDLTAEMLYNAMFLDKKVLGGKLHLILPTCIGEVVIRSDIDKQHVLEAISHCF